MTRLTRTARRRIRPGLFPAVAALSALLLCPRVLFAGQSEPPAPLTTLIVGGGPTPEYNQVAIESNVRFVDGLLPAGSPRRILFASGNPAARNVQYTEPGRTLTSSETAFGILFGLKSSDGGGEKYRAARLRVVNGPSTAAGLDSEFERLRSASGDGSLLLYFTGHGEADQNNDLDNNAYNLWGNSNLTVRSLATRLKRLPEKKPVVLVMVQCFGGAFGNLIFENGDPRPGVLTDRPLCGFFATTRDRVAAGCTPEVDEAEYRDFTGSFFAALTGKDRLGRPVRATDFDGDGVIEMDEAMAWAQMTEPSIDVPMCTSDVFLRRFLSLDDDVVTATPYSRIVGWASPAQRAVMERLSVDLRVSGEGRLKTALAAVREDAEISDGGERDVDMTPAVSAAYQNIRHWKNDLSARFPALRRRSASARARAEATALAWLKAHAEAVRSILKSDATISGAESASYAAELRGARWLRLMRVAKSVVLERRLRESGDTARIAAFDQLRALEHRNPLKESHEATSALSPSVSP